MSKAKVIVNKLLEGDPDDPRAYLDWLGQKVETGPLDKIRFGAHIHLSDEDMIRENAAEQGIDVDSQAFWDEVERCMAIMESNCLQLLREAGLHVSDEGHDETGARVASVWIDTDEEDRKLALLKAVINWAEGDWPSTTSGTMDYAFGADTTQRIYAATEDAARFIDVTIEFTGTDALVEWSRLNLNEAVTGDPDDPEVFLKSYMPRMMGRVFIDFDTIKPHFPDAPANWVRDKVNGLDLFRYNRVTEMREVLRQMKADYRQRGPNVPVDVITYRYKVPNPQGSSIVRGWLDKIGCPVPVIQWLCETNAPTWFFVAAKEFNAYMQMVYPQVKLESVAEGVDDPPADLVNRLTPKVQCPKCGATAELGYGADKLDTHPTAPIEYDTDVPIARYLHPADEHNPNVSIHHFDTKHIYKCRECGERFDGTLPGYAVESVDDPDDPQTFLKSYRKIYYKLFYGSKFGEGAFVGVYDSLDDVVQAAKERKLRKRARHVWATEEAYPDAPEGVVAGSEPTGFVYDILKGYKVAEPRRVVIEGVDDPPADIADQISHSLKCPYCQATDVQFLMGTMAHKGESDIWWCNGCKHAFSADDRKAQIYTVEGVDDPDDPEMFIKRFKPRWDLLSHIKNGHFYFKDEAGRVAVADYSMRNQRDPQSSDDGLLVLDKTKPITRYRGIGGKKMWHIPVTQYYGGLGDKPIPSATGASEEEFADLWPKIEPLGFKQAVREDSLQEFNYLLACRQCKASFFYYQRTLHDKCPDCGSTDLAHGEEIRQMGTHPSITLSAPKRRGPKPKPKPAALPEPPKPTEQPALTAPPEPRKPEIKWPSNWSPEIIAGLKKAAGLTEADDDEDIDPKQYLDATTGWIDTFLNAGMQPDTSGEHDGQFWKRYECHGFNYMLVVGSRVPRFMLVMRNDALYGTNTFRRVFEYPDQDINGLVTEFTALNRLLTKAITCAFDGFPAFDEKIDQIYKQHKSRRQRWLSGKIKESVDDPEQYLKGNVYTLDELRDKLQNYGLSFPSNGIKPWGRWAVIDGFTYWAVYSKDPEKWLPQSYFREQLEKFCKDMGFTVYHIQLFGEYPEGITFKLAVPKMQLDPEAYGAQERRLNDPDFDNERQAHEIIQRDWLPEAEVPVPAEDAPEHYVRTAHVDIKRIIPSLGFKKPDEPHGFGPNHYFFYGNEDDAHSYSDRYTLTIHDDPETDSVIVCGWRDRTGSMCVSVSYDNLAEFVNKVKDILSVKGSRPDVGYTLKNVIKSLGESLDVDLPPEDEPTPNIEKHAQHVEKVEADAIESAILNATNEFDTLVRLRNIDNAKRADELAAELGAKWAETAGYPNGSDEFDMVVSAVNNHCGEMFPGQWEDYPESDYPFQEALEDPDDPQAFLQHMETDWRKILRKHGFKPHPHSDHLSYTLEYPDRVWGANWPMRIYAGHGWNPEPEFQYDHPDPDNPDLDAEDAAYEQWERDHGLAAEINRRDVNFPHYVYFQFGREYYRRVEVPTNKLDNFLTRLIRGAKKIVGTEHIDHDHPETSDLTTMLWNLAKQIARELQIPLKESLDAPPEDEVNPEAYLHHLTQTNLTDLYQQYGLQPNNEGDYGHGLMELGKPATLVWHGKTHTIEKINLAVHTHPFQQWASVSIYIRPVSNEASWRSLKELKFRYWTVPLTELHDVVHKMIYEVEGVCLVNDLTWPEMVVQFKEAMKRFRPYRSMTVRKKKVVEGIDDPTPEFLQATFDVPTILKRMGYEKSMAPLFKWYKVFHRMPTELDIMVEVRRRGQGGEENEADIVYDITVYRYPVNDNPGREWVPVAYRYERNNKQLERVLLKLEDRIRRNDLRGIRDEVAESVPEPPPEDDPTDVIRSHEQNLLPAELKRLDFGPKPEQGKEWIYGVEMPRYWWNRYQAADGKTHGLYVYFIGGQTPEVRANNWNFDAKAWFQRGGEAPTDSPAQSEAHFCAIIRDLDDAMKRSAADSLSPQQEHEAIDAVLKHHRKWWDDTLDYLINTKGGTVPGRIGPGQPA